MSKKIAVIGANEPLLHYYARAKELGYEIHSFAWEQGSVCKQYADYFYPISFVEKETILELCKEININGITSFSLESALPAVSFIATKLNLPGNPPECIKYTANKYTMRQRLKECGINVPNFFLVDEINDLNRHQFPFPVIVKPIDNGGSRGVTLVNNKCELELAYNRALGYSKLKKVLVEEYIHGREFSVEYISNKGIHYFLAVTDKITTGNPYFVELEHHQPAQITSIEKNKIINITEHALSALGMYSSASHTELKLTETGEIYLIETGFRMGGDRITEPLVRLSTGYDLTKGVLELATGEFSPPVFGKQMNSGIYFLSKESENVESYIANSKLFPEIVLSSRKNNELKNIRESQDRSGYFIYQSENKFKLS